MAAVNDGRIRFVPDNWNKTFFNWMENIRDWCISRQLWWGHRIPAWHCADCHKITVAREAPQNCAHCGSARIEQDPDVLDTWFSSSLWPFSTLGWPDDTEDLRTYYPTSLLITGFDILFFWAARMMMMGLELTGDVPFREVHMHGAGARSHAPEDVEDQGQRGGPARHQRQVRHRRRAPVASDGRCARHRHHLHEDTAQLARASSPTRCGTRRG